MAARQPAVVESSKTGGGQSRGWQILRSHWREFLAKRHGVPDRVLASEVPLVQPLHGHILSDEAADRTLQRIIATIRDEESDSHKTWQHLDKIHREVRSTLAEKMGWNLPKMTETPDTLTIVQAAWDRHKRELATKEEKLAGGSSSYTRYLPPPHEVLMPPDWWQLLGDETLADLIVDSFASALCDAFIDAAVVLVDTAKGWSHSQPPVQNISGQSKMLKSASESALRAAGQSHTSFLDQQSSFGGAQTTGFTMSGLPANEWDSWRSSKFHACQPLEPYVTRIAKSTEAQRPRRRKATQSQGPQGSATSGASRDLRRYNWPMLATNLPDTWENISTAKQNMRRGQQLAETDDVAKAQKDVLSIGMDGKTLFPYSLASHRAFLNSQKDPVLREKARKVVPLRTTDSLYSS